MNSDVTVAWQSKNVLLSALEKGAKSVGREVNKIERLSRFCNS